MKPTTASSALRVQAVPGEGFDVVEFETSTRTVADAAAGGIPNAVFRLSPDDLLRLTGGDIAAIAKQGRQD